MRYKIVGFYNRPLAVPFIVKQNSAEKVEVFIVKKNSLHRVNLYQHFIVFFSRVKPRIRDKVKTGYPGSGKGRLFVDIVKYLDGSVSLPVQENDVVTYHIEITNNSPVCNIVDGRLDDHIPHDVLFSSADLQIIADPGTVAQDDSLDPPAGDNGNGLVRISGIDLLSGGAETCPETP